MMSNIWQTAPSSTTFYRADDPTKIIDNIKSDAENKLGRAPDACSPSKQWQNQLNNLFRL